jgi:hypothetical protein
VREDDRVVVDVNDPAFRRHLLGDLVRIVRGRDAGADVEKLADSRIFSQIAHCTGQKGTIGANRENDIWIGLDRLLTGHPVGGEIVLPAKPVIINAATCATLVSMDRAAS